MVQEAFGIVVVVVVVVAAVVAVWTVAGAGRAYDEIGRSLLVDEGGDEGAGSLADEVRSLVEPSNERCVRAGRSPLDVEAEVARRLRELAD